jgi:16S rRNA (adenine1518-N6/adenine1519-N6)-dimethyltransferase
MKLTSPSQISAWCAAHGFKPNRMLGQNFLIDQNTLDFLVDAAELRPGSRVLEVGPGLGVVTEALIERGACVTAVEKDPVLAERLPEALAEVPEGRLRVIPGDMLEQDLDALLAPPGFDVCVSNLPYSCGTRILMDLARHPLAPSLLVVTVQLEVAERFAAPPRHPARGLASVWLQRLYDIEIARVVKPTCFWPRPEVSSAIVRLRRHGREPLTPVATERFESLVRLGFTHRRKQLATTLRHAPAPFTMSPEHTAAFLSSLGLDPRVRPEELTVAEWRSLAAESLIHSPPEPV